MGPVAVWAAQTVGAAVISTVVSNALSSQGQNADNSEALEAFLDMMSQEFTNNVENIIKDQSLEDKFNEVKVKIDTAVEYMKLYKTLDSDEARNNCRQARDAVICAHTNLNALLHKVLEHEKRSVIHDGIDLLTLVAAMDLLTLGAYANFEPEANVVAIEHANKYIEWATSLKEKYLERTFERIKVINYQVEYTYRTEKSKIDLALGGFKSGHDTHTGYHTYLAIQVDEENFLEKKLEMNELYPEININGFLFDFGEPRPMQELMDEYEENRAWFIHVKKQELQNEADSVFDRVFDSHPCGINQAMTDWHDIIKIYATQHLQFCATSDEHIAIATDLIERKNADVSNNHSICLHSAIVLRQFQIADLFIDKGADINAQNGEQFIQISTSDGDLTQQLLSLQFYLDHGVDIVHQDCKALKEVNHVDKLSKHLEHCTSQSIDINHRVNEFLINYVDDDKVECIKKIIEFGADVQVEQNKPLKKAIERNQLALCQWLIEHGADIHVNDEEAMKTFKDDVDATKWFIEHEADINSDNDTILRHYVGENNYDMCKWLIEHGANVNADSDIAIKTFYQNKDAVIWLTGQGADLHADNEKVFRYTLSQNDHEMVKWCIEQGVDANYDNFLALRQYMTSNNKDMVKWLLTHGTDIHADNELVLKTYALRNDVDMVKWLIRHGANHHVDDESILRHFVAENKSDMVAWLLGPGNDEQENPIAPAEINLDNGKTSACHVSASHGLLAMTQFLVSKGADIYRKDANNRTPENLSATNNQVNFQRTRLYLHQLAVEDKLSKVTESGDVNEFHCILNRYRQFLQDNQYHAEARHYYNILNQHRRGAPFLFRALAQQHPKAWSEGVVAAIARGADVDFEYNGQTPRQHATALAANEQLTHLDYFQCLLTHSDEIKHHYEWPGLSKASAMQLMMETAIIDNDLERLGRYLSFLQEPTSYVQNPSLISPLSPDQMTEYRHECDLAQRTLRQDIHKTTYPFFASLMTAGQQPQAGQSVFDKTFFEHCLSYASDEAIELWLQSLGEAQCFLYHRPDDVYRACHDQRPSVAKMLLEYGADPLLPGYHRQEVVQNNNNRTLLNDASTHRRAKYLNDATLQRVYFPEKREMPSEPSLVYSEDNNNTHGFVQIDNDRSALFRAARYHDESRLNNLLGTSRIGRELTNEVGDSLLHILVQVAENDDMCIDGHASIEMMKSLFRRFNCQDDNDIVDITGEKGWSPIHIAAMHDLWAVMLFLTETKSLLLPSAEHDWKSDINLNTERGCSPLTIAVLHQSITALRQSLALGADPEKQRCIPPQRLSHLLPEGARVEVENVLDNRLNYLSAQALCRAANNIDSQQVRDLLEGRLELIAGDESSKIGVSAGCRDLFGRSVLAHAILGANDTSKNNYIVALLCESRFHEDLIAFLQSDAIPLLNQPPILQATAQTAIQARIMLAHICVKKGLYNQLNDTIQREYNLHRLSRNAEIATDIRADGEHQRDELNNVRDANENMRESYQTAEEAFQGMRRAAMGMNGNFEQMRRDTQGLHHDVSHMNDALSRLNERLARLEASGMLVERRIGQANHNGNDNNNRFNNNNDNRRRFGLFDRQREHRNDDAANQNANPSSPSLNQGGNAHD